MAVGKGGNMDTKKIEPIQKPLSVGIVELKNNLTSILNNSSLPICVIEMIVRDIYADIVQITTSAYQKDLLDYETSIKEGVVSNGNNDSENTSTPG